MDFAAISAYIGAALGKGYYFLKVFLRVTRYKET
jgi:hypothetical protein